MAYIRFFSNLHQAKRKLLQRMPEHISPISTSVMADRLIPSEIIKLASDIQKMMQSGQFVYNLTIGDFDPGIFPIPEALKTNINKAYELDETNYPAANGVAELRQSLASLIQTRLKLEYSPEDILVSGGARPLIYAVYRTLIDPGDLVLFPVPSWNNNHYCHLSGATPVPLEVGPEQNFMPLAADIKPHIGDATLIALCSPQNPTGTVFTREALLDIADLVVMENKKREGKKKPVYLMYDQIYWELCFGNTEHFHPVQLIPEIRPYVLSIDGMSKAFAATGIRVGWAFGPNAIMAKMRAILSHVGAWAPKPEQVATSWFLNQENEVDDYLNWFKPEVHERLQKLYEGILHLKQEGFPIDCIHPQAAIYLTVRCPWKGLKNSDGILKSQNEVTQYLLGNCQLAFVPFKSFGASEESEWYRISVGTLKKDDISKIIAALRQGMVSLKTA